MRTCQTGHESADEDFCDVCGLALDASEKTAPMPSLTRCPACDTQLEGRFCEACGHDSVTGARPRAPAPLPASRPQRESSGDWTATVTADREHYDAVTAAGNGVDLAGFPRAWQQRRYLLRGEQVSIGRRSRSRGITPDIDLAGPPEDFGVSHLHALLLPRQDGGWSLVDVGSTNGTMLNDQPYPVTINAPTPLEDGDRIYVGAWSVITIQHEVQ